MEKDTLGRTVRRGADSSAWRGGISKNHYHYKKLQKQRYPEKIKARTAVYDAIRRGHIVRGACEVCSSAGAHAHHDDYSRRLDVRWFCRTHHRELHLTMRQQPVNPTLSTVIKARVTHPPEAQANTVASSPISVSTS